MSLASLAMCSVFLWSPDSGFHPDEETYLAVSLEMFRTGNWLVPRLELEPVFFKPPLLYWLQCTSFAVFGPSLAAARLPSLLGTLGLAALTSRLPREATDETRLRLFLVVLSSVAALRFGALAMMDPLFSLALLGAAVCTARVPRGLLAAAACVALAILLKGPVGAVLGFGVVVLSAWQHQRRFSAGMILAAFALTAALVVPWYALMAQRFGAEFWDKFLVREHLGKLGAINLPINFALNLLFVAIATAPAWLLGINFKPVDGWRGGWFVALFVAAYSLQTSRQLHYYLPVVPFAALHCTFGENRPGPRRAFLFALALSSAAGGALLVSAGQRIAGVLFFGLTAALVAAGLRPVGPRATVLAVLVTWTAAVGLAPRLLFPPSWPSTLSASTGGEPVAIIGRDPGVLALATGVDVHRAPARTISGRPGLLWIAPAAQCRDAGATTVASWSRLGERAPAATVWRAVASASVEPLLEAWELCRERPAAP
ncbi:MAG: hypothetical protein AB1938_12720 [Myxococcota bacterium]